MSRPPMSPTSKATSGSSAALLGAALSLFVLSLQFSEPLGSDEVWTLQAVQQGFSGILATLRADVHPPLYFLLLKIWCSLAGYSDWALQGFSALCFLISQFVLYRFFAHRGMASQGLFAALFLLNPLGLLVCHFARMYSLLMLLQLLSVLLWWRLNEGKGGEWAFLAVNVLGTFTHIWFFFHLAALFVVTAFYPRRRRTLLSLVGALVPYALLWAPVLLAQIRLSAEAGAWLPKPGVDDILETMLLHLVLAAPVLAVLAVYWLFQRRLPPWPKEAVALACWLVLFLGIPFALSAVKPIYYQRFTIGALPVFALLAAYSLPPLQHIASVVLALCIGAFSVAQYRNPPVCTSRWTANYLQQRLGPGDRVLFTSLARAPVKHYSQPVGGASLSFPTEIDTHPGYEPNYTRLLASGQLAQEASQSVAALAAQGVKRVWLVHGFRPVVSETISRALALSYSKQQSESFQCNATPCYHNQLDLYVLKP
jgi:uncharacterized membrane protein